MKSARKKNVLFLTRKWPPAIGGMENYSYHLAKAMSEQADLQTHVLPGRNDGRPPSMFALLIFFFSSAAVIFRNRRADVIHIGDFVLWPLYVVAKIVNRNAVVAITAYGLDLLYAKKEGTLPFVYGIYLWFCRLFCSKSIRVIAISSATARVCKQEGYRFVRIVPPGVELNFEKHMQADLTSKPPYVLFVGRLVRRKGAGWFIANVLPLLPPEMRLAVVGKKWDEEEFSVLQSSSKVDYHGVVSDDELKQLRRGAIAVLMPNIPGNGADMEGFGLTALEAAADGGVLLASGIEGIVDAVIDGQTGFLLPTLDAQAWCAKILEIQHWKPERRQEFVADGFDVVRSKFDWNRVSQEIMSAYFWSANE